MYPHLFVHLSSVLKSIVNFVHTMCAGCTLTSYPSGCPPSRCRMRWWPSAEGGTEERQREKEREMELGREEEREKGQGREEEREMD